LRAHSVLRLSLDGAQGGAARDEGFSAGLAAGLDSPQRLPALLFKVRAGSLLSGRRPDWNAGFLSGLLIGAEIGGQRDWIGDVAGDVPLIGSPGLCALYQQGLAQLGVASHVVDAADATLAGLKLARELAS
jgi:2-dehydro-3-deoxygalactonokinase